MKKVVVTLEFEGDEAEYIDAKSGGVDVGVLLRDALADFRMRRMPIETYVTERYAESDDRFRRFKKGDVAKRIAFSAVLSNALVTINVSGTDRAEEIEQILRNCPNCKKTMEVHDFMEVAPCAEHQLLALKLKEMLPGLRLKEVMKSVRQCRRVWVPGVLHPPGSTLPEVKTRCTLPDGHTGLHSWGSEEPTPERPRPEDEDFSDE